MVCAAGQGCRFGWGRELGVKRGVYGGMADGGVRWGLWRERWMKGINEGFGVEGGGRGGM